MQTPPLQNGVLPLHALPHEPQFALLVRTSVQVPLQLAWPNPQHFPALQCSFAAQAVVHAPQ